MLLKCKYLHLDFFYVFVKIERRRDILHLLQVLVDVTQMFDDAQGGLDWTGTQFPPEEQHHLNFDVDNLMLYEGGQAGQLLYYKVECNFSFITMFSVHRSKSISIH